MKRFIIRCIVFAFLMLILGTIADVAISYKGRHSSIPDLKLWNEWYGKTDRYDVVINGSSRGFVQYDPEIIDSILCTNSFNLSIDGSNINRQIIKYHVFTRTHPKPKLLIQNFCFYTLNITRGYCAYQYYPYWNDRELVKMQDEWEHFSWKEKYLPMMRWLMDTEHLRNLLYHSGSERTVKKGYSPHDEKWDGKLLEDALKNGRKYARDTTAIRIFCEFIEKTKAEGTEIVFVHAPIYKDVYDKVVDDPKGMFALYDSIATAYNIPLLDYSQMPLCADTAYFYNATHMNRKGAEIFTRQLAHDIDSLGLLKR